MNKYRHTLLFLLTTVIIYLALYSLYLFLSVGLPDKTIYLQLRRYIPCAFAVSSAAWLWWFDGLSLKRLIPHIIVGVSWIYVYPLCYWITFHLNTTFIDNHFDISFGSYIFAFTVCLRILLLKYGTRLWQRIDVILMSLLHTALMIIPTVQIIYFLSYHSPVTEAGAMAVLQTNMAEAKEFILLNFGYAGLGAFILFELFLFIFFYRLNRLDNFSSALLPKGLITALIICIAAGCYSYKSFADTGVMEKYLNAKAYFEMAEKFNDYHQRNLAQLEVTLPEKTFEKPSTIIMVIGESASRYYMSAYDYKERDTTPWMREMSAKPDFILFKHAYTSWGQTVPSLERALTEKNQYNDKEFNDSITLLDLAKRAGYTTYWFSNQGTISNADTPITIVAKTADHTAFVEDTLANTSTMKYDGDLLPYLKQVDPNKNNFIVLHIMGSHDNCINRYPPEFTRWGAPNEYEQQLNYDNSIAYTDKFLQDVFTYSKEKLNLQAMLYFSDHGADPLWKRNPDINSFISLRIPLFLYLSDEYRQLYPETASVFRSHENSYFTNDLMYEVIAGILNIKSNHYDEENSLASPSYKYTRDTLTTRLGKSKLSEDTEEQQ